MRSLTSKSCYLPILSVLTFFFISPPASHCRKIRESRTSLRHFVSLFSSLCIILPLADLLFWLILLFCQSFTLRLPLRWPLHTHKTCWVLTASGEQGMAQLWERSPPTNVARVQIPASTPYVGWVCCWFSPLLREVFLRLLRFSPLLKTQHFQIPIPSGIG